MKTKIEIYIDSDYLPEFTRRLHMLMGIPEGQGMYVNVKNKKIKTHADLKEKFFNAIRRRVLKEGGRIRNYDVMTATGNFVKVEQRKILIKELEGEGRLIVEPYIAEQGIESFYFNIPIKYL